MLLACGMFLFFFNDTATTEIYTLSLHDALPIFLGHPVVPVEVLGDHRLQLDQDRAVRRRLRHGDLRGSSRSTARDPDRKSTRLNSSHANISYAVFCLKKKKLY